MDATTDIFDAVRSAVLLDTNGRVRIAASQGIPESVSRSVQLGFASGLMRWFEERACLIDSRLNPEAADAVKELQVLGVRLGVPLLCGGHVAGAILVGDKASGLEYTAEERELLIAVARSASIAFENAALYKNVSHQEQRLDGVLANIAAGVVTVRSNKTIGLLNSAGERILQLRAADVVGRSVQKLGSSFADVVLRALAEHKPYLRQEIHDPAINATLGLSATPLGDDGVAVVFSKLPEQETRSEDIAYSPFWEYLASRVAQEIKNPMVAINTFAQLLPRKYESQEFRESFGDVVQKEVERINHVVDTLFEFARRPRLVIQRASLNETVASVLQSFQDELGKHSIELETQWDSEQPDADLDPVYFAQALHNVVQNSIEAMPAGGRINVTTKQERGACQVIVADSGPGIRPQDESLLFLPFFSTKEQGMGLGLTVADRIMKQHAGDIRLLKSNNGGSAFELRLPKTKVIGQ
ncbi:MAG TPA: hypothetical protein HPP83_11600 [Candidatus Hydrogenedentes bacterium]|nr:hypothetical protein [Candidatus Hydrogenedentota bacterium]